ncbi:MAG: class II fumarate hydratase [Desulfobacterales bacterium]|uniref:Fumarate hydratase class II n=1 Tax=Candidatus Desulfatibia profunda TaxID=2841695 RepID=A0A8J6TJI8_9BACT|nr:class II fumarate hydratase [Candidatus Desulfatibia profunda]MBL7180547.1 class II fumarate hydratase [Desulfobacterales bacterium]
MKFREEKDTMGTVRIPEDAYYGPQTRRAIENFPVSGLTLPAAFIHALALIKQCSARVNLDLELLKKDISKAIVQAAGEVMEGEFNDQFVVDVFQTGSGTSTNMNMNEVIASRANEILTGRKGGKAPVHPNDHVNLGQSSNDVIPSTIHVSAWTSITGRLIPSLALLHQTMLQKALEFDQIKKIGRTHLQDAVPLSLGQEFSGYARQIELGVARIKAVEERLTELAIGGTAVGTGLNTHPDFAAKVIALISEYAGLAFRPAKNRFEAQAARDAAVETSGALKTIAVSLVKIANDIRWLASGPRCGLGEITIPELQPGSSIMPGKVNPVIPEAVIQVAAQVMGNDTTIMLGGQGGNFELNAMLPVIAYNLLQSIFLLAAAANIFAEKCIGGISANRETCAAFIEKSLALATALVPHIGYDRAAAIAKKAHETGKTIRQIASQENILPADILNKLFF